MSDIPDRSDDITEEITEDSYENISTDKNILTETFNLNELFLIQFSEEESPFLSIVLDIEVDNFRFKIQNIEKKDEEYFISFNDQYEIILSNDQYSIYDLIKVKEIKKDS